MRDRSISVLIVVVVILGSFSVFVTILPDNVKGTTLFVGGVGPGNYTTIQSAVYAALPGDTVFIFNGTYNENVVVSQTLSLVGENQENTLVVGDPYKLDVIQVTADWVNISGLAVTGSEVGIQLDYVRDCHIANSTTFSNEYAGVSIYHSNNNTVENLTSYSNSMDGILMFEADDNTVTYSNLSNNGYGLWMEYADDGVIHNNRIFSNNSNRGGILLRSSIGDSILGNVMSVGGVVIDWNTFWEPIDLIEYWNSHIIDVSNTLNGNPIYYWKNTSGGRVPSGAGQIIIANCTAVVVDGQNLNNGSVGITVAHSTNITIANNTVRTNSLYGIRVHRSDHNLINNNSAGYNGETGLYLFHSDNNTVDKNILFSNDESGLVLVASVDNTVHMNHAFSNYMYGIHLAGSSNNTLTNNRALTNDETGIYLRTSDGNRISNNNASWNMKDGICVDRSDLNLVINNSVSVNQNGGINVGFYSSGNTVLNNDASWNLVGGIIIAYSYANDIVGNTLFRNFDGIFLPGSHNNTIEANTAIQSWDTGIHFESSIWNVVSGNDLLDNIFGIGLIYKSDNNTISDNEVSSNFASGINVMDSSNNTLINNSIFDNDWGVEIIYDSHNNKVYHNNFINNAGQAYDHKANMWDNGYPSGGNFWSDYAGIDIMNGPNQDQIGSDGIGDTPYFLAYGSNPDRYPLMNPVGPPPMYPPSAPRNLEATAGNLEVTLTWEAPFFDGSSPVTNYRIYRGTSPGTELLLAEVGNVLTYTDTFLLTNGQTYYYVVTAKNAIGVGPMSNEVTATPTSLPGAPLLLTVALGGGNCENVIINWTLSSDDGSGQDSVVEYRIFRHTIFDPTGASYELYASVPHGSSTFIDGLAGEGDPSNYFYQICAVDLNNQTSCTQSQGGKFTRFLPEGIALVSIPLYQSNNDLEVILQTVLWDNAWSQDHTREWVSSSKSKSYNPDLSEVYIPNALWINVTSNSNLTVAGIVPVETVIPLYAGWNLVGFPSFNITYTVGDLKAETGATRVEGFDPSSPPYFLRVLQDTDILLAGQGYWIFVPSDVDWVVSSS